jgi:hypothetical protein
MWRKTVTKESLAAHEERFTVVSTKLVAGRPVIRVLADAAPDASFEPVTPDLEDVYFAQMRGLGNGPAAPASVEA